MLQLGLWNASCLHFTSSLLDVFLSLTRFSLCLSPHPLNRVSFSSLYELQIESIPKRPPARLCGRSRACIFVSFPNRSIFVIASSWCRDSILRPSESTVPWPTSKSLLFRCFHYSDVSVIQIPTVLSILSTFCILGFGFFQHNFLPSLDPLGPVCGVVTHSLHQTSRLPSICICFSVILTP